jgi:hypothetical protein
MSDTALEPIRQAAVKAGDHLSVPAIVTYWLLLIWSGLIWAVVDMVVHKVEISGIMLAVLTGLIGTQTTLLVASVSFWVGATMGGKQANERLAEASRIANETLARQAEGNVVPFKPAPGTAVTTAAADVTATTTVSEATPAEDDTGSAKAIA